MNSSPRTTGTLILAQRRCRRRRRGHDKLSGPPISLKILFPKNHVSKNCPRRITLFLLLTILLFSAGAALAASYQYIRLGDKADSTATPNAGTAMMGGGKDLDEAFRWLCKKANGGDFLVLRARGDDDYNSYVNGMCKLNSVATLIIPDPAAAQDPAVADIIRHAEAVFIAGGNQARYVELLEGHAGAGCHQRKYRQRQAHRRHQRRTCCSGPVRLRLFERQRRRQ